MAASRGRRGSPYRSTCRPGPAVLPAPPGRRRMRTSSRHQRHCRSGLTTGLPWISRPALGPMPGRPERSWPAHSWRAHSLTAEQSSRLTSCRHRGWRRTRRPARAWRSHQAEGSGKVVHAASEALLWLRSLAAKTVCIERRRTCPGHSSAPESERRRHRTMMAIARKPAARVRPKDGCTVRECWRGDEMSLAAPTAS
jgi:hypothetical protein